MRVVADKKFPLPIGIEAKIVAMAFTTEEKVYAGWQELEIKEDGEIEVEIKRVEKDDLLAYLDSL